MLVEGIGTVAPQRQRFGLTEANLRLFMMLARERAKHRQYGASANQWRKGLRGPLNIEGVGTVAQEERSCFIGLLGEYAAQQYIDRRFPGECCIDTSLLPYGDFGVDLKAFGLKIDVKTREQHPEPVNRVKATNDRGERLPPFKCNVFLFTEWSVDAPSSVYLLGWQWTAFVASQPLMPSVGKWLNVCLFDNQLLPMARIRDELETWKARKQWL